MEWLYTKLALIVTFTYENIVAIFFIILSLVLLGWYQSLLEIVVEMLLFIALWGFIVFINHGELPKLYYVIGSLVFFSLIDFLYYNSKSNKVKQDGECK